MAVRRGTEQEGEGENKSDEISNATWKATGLGNHDYNFCRAYTFPRLLTWSATRYVSVLLFTNVLSAQLGISCQHDVFRSKEQCDIHQKTATQHQENLVITNINFNAFCASHKQSNPFFFSHSFFFLTITTHFLCKLHQLLPALRSPACSDLPHLM